MAARRPARRSTHSDRSRASRRSFIKTAAAAGAGVMIVPRHVLGQGVTAPSDRLNIATVGIGGMGGSNTEAVMTENIVAICDCDFGLLDERLTGWHDEVYPPEGSDASSGGTNRRRGPAGGFEDFGPSTLQRDADTRWTVTPEATRLRQFVDEQVPRVRRYQDYRVMLEQQPDIDAVIVATPDHMHAPIAAAAMDLGKHVYVQKPLCWSVHEARYLAQKAEDTGVVTQMGNQGHSTDGARRGQEYLTSGAIGEVSEVHVWTNRPFAYWPQGIPRPAPFQAEDRVPEWNSQGVQRRLAAAMAGGYPVPDGLSWDLFLGAAPVVPYHPVYHPFNWRGWVDWGQGALGDMGAHLIDHPVWALELGLPTSIETVSSIFDGICYPTASTTYYEFPATANRPAVKMTWYDGGLMPPRPEELGDTRLDATGGVLYIGNRGKMLQDTYGVYPRLLPAEHHNSYGPPPESLPRIPHESHEMNWVNAIKGTDTISCPFSYAAHLNEIMLLGVVALRANAKLTYDGAAMRVTNTAGAEANRFLSREYRAGFGLA